MTPNQDWPAEPVKTLLINPPEVEDFTTPPPSGVVELVKKFKDISISAQAVADYILTLLEEKE